MSGLDRFGLDGQCAFVNGAGRGIGAAAALALAAAGADVAIRACEPDELQGTAGMIAAVTGRRVEIFVVADDRADAVAALDTAAERLGKLTILVNVAGGAPTRPFTATDDTDVRRALELNLELPLRLARAAVPHLRAAGGGSIVNISSAMAHMTSPGFVLYGAAKAGLEQATRLLAADLAPEIRVNAVSPGAVLTRALERYIEAEREAHLSIAATPLRRLATPDDVAMAVVYLCSPAAAYVTGIVLPVEGGIQRPVFGARQSTH